MATTGQTTTITSRRQRVLTSGLLWRLLFALCISALIVLAFFVTNAVSH